VSNSSIGQVFALAGLLQCTYLVDQLAQTGQAKPEDLSPLLDSLFRFDADSPQDVYGGHRGLSLGLGILQDLLDATDTTRYRATVRYAMSIVYLQAKLSTQQELQEIIHTRLQHAAIKQSHFSNNINEIASSIAAIYQDTVSTFNYRIQVNGSAQQLQDPANADMIRALLLAAIRSAVLWRQSGGKRWHFLFSRRRLRHTLAKLSSD
jgi:high frequency lysogenization protein